MNQESKGYFVEVIAASFECGLFLVWTVISIWWLLNRLVDSGQI